MRKELIEIVNDQAGRWTLPCEEDMICTPEAYNRHIVAPMAWPFNPLSWLRLAGWVVRGIGGVANWLSISPARYEEAGSEGSQLAAKEYLG